MFSLKDAADYIASLGIVNNDHVWIGKLQDKADESLGVYPLRRSGMPRIPIGGLKNTDHDTKRISILIHWNRNVVASEEIAACIYEKIRDTKNVAVNEQKIMFTQMLVPEAVPVGTDENGIYEYVIEAEIYYERMSEENE